MLQLKKEAADSLKASEQSAEAQQKAASKQWGSTKGSAKSTAQSAWDAAQKARNEVGKPADAAKEGAPGSISITSLVVLLCSF